ncbi:cysteine-rich receptor-like protein kinase 46 [Malania oleifera]|uniref:cysteine-rich receptor-like protein kinase 46 n=1 Tax=Malania oleifera TaxID=397392 RepID=UPI0025AE1D5C|nr:cysteine-rich receptor-like protein kinase 46 [Malania oleifera]
MAIRFLPLIVLVSALIPTLNAGHNEELDLIARTCTKEVAENGKRYAKSYDLMREDMNKHVRVAMAYNHTSTANPPHKMFMLAECHDHLSAKKCQSCVHRMGSKLRDCSSRTGGRVYLDGCFLRVDNYSFFEEIISPSDLTRCGISKNYTLEFANGARKLIKDVATHAPLNKSRWDFRSMEYNGSSVHGMAKCWHTLDKISCAKCLEIAASLASKCLPSTEGRVLNAGCFLHYSDYQLLDVSSDPPADSPFSYIYYALGAVVFCALAFSMIFFGWRFRFSHSKMNWSGVEMNLSILSRGLEFKFSTLEKATEYFSETHKLGQGGYGEVFRGVLQDGREIAVKRLFVTGRSRGPEVYNELDIISSAQHKNLVRFLGRCFTDDDSLLIYEFLPNKSLDLILFDLEKKKELDWKKRLGIILGTAEGLDYLHKECRVRIIHRDIKASNILLDLRYKPKISDFGLARFHMHGKTVVSTSVAGTLGYMAPEYLAQGRLTEKVDVYAFGVLILEIVSGVPNNDFEDEESFDTLVTTTWKHFQLKTISEIIDKSMMENSEDIEEIKRVVQVGLLCTQESLTLRPSMSMVVEILKQKDMELPVPSKPPFTDVTKAASNSSSSCILHHTNDSHL